jgi:hypothetical protein
VSARHPYRILLAVAAAATFAPLLIGPPAVGAVPRAVASIHPGGEVNFGGVSCEIGAIMRQGPAVFLAVPASCGGIDAGKVQDGCDEPVSPSGVPVSIEGAKYRGHLVYNSFTEMQLAGVMSTQRCYYDDLALVQVNPRDRHLVSAAIPGTAAPLSILSILPRSGTMLQMSSARGTAGATQHHGWLVTDTMTALSKTSNVGAPVTVRKKLVGMLLVLAKGPIPGLPVLQAPAQIYNLARAIRQLHEIPRFRHVRLVQAGQRA